MTTLATSVENDPKYKRVLNCGFIGLVDAMPNEPGEGDLAIVSAARVSYGKGTKKVSEDRGLIRYLMRHYHSTPFEMVEFKFHAKMPIFIARQWVRHRTANINEYSGRYSVMSNEFYVPEPAQTQPQSKENHQGRGGALTDKEIEGCRWMINVANEHAYDTYSTLLGDYNDPSKQLDALYDPYSLDGWFDSTFPGLARELARGVLTLNNYTEWYWKIDLHNLMHFLFLRADSHAQWEIQQYANAIYELIKPYVPLACEAYEDYRLHAAHVSRMEKEMIIFIMNNGMSSINDFNGFAKSYGLSMREIEEFKKKFNIA
jgi:thymidylate synthase (FAD)